MINRIPSQPLQHRWQFQVGVACLVFPLLFLIGEYASIYQSATSESGIDESIIVNGVKAELNSSGWLLPMMLLGVVFIMFARRRGKG